MTRNEIEKRLETLEAEVALLKSRTEKNVEAEKPWYKQIPKFGGNPAYEEAARLGREYRRAQQDPEDDK
jgi:hypothetical protein